MPQRYPIFNTASHARRAPRASAHCFAATWQLTLNNHTARAVACGHVKLTGEPQTVMTRIVGVILAGGKASRMNNADKPLLPLGGRAVIEYVIDLARPQVEELVISVNRNLACFRCFDLPLVADLPANCEGPLLGICSAMQWFHDQATDAQYLACFPADVPSFPSDLVSQLYAVLNQPAAADDASSVCRDDTVAWCQTGDQVQPLFSLWPLSILPTLRHAIKKGIHGPRLLFRSHPNVRLKLPLPGPPQFFNINTPQQLAAAEQWFEGQNRNR